MTVGAITNVGAYDEEVIAVVNDGLMMYLGTNKGNVKKYVLSSGVLTTIANVGASILNMSIYSSWLYVSCTGGKLVGVAIS